MSFHVAIPIAIAATPAAGISHLRRCNSCDGESVWSPFSAKAPLPTGASPGDKQNKGKIMFFTYEEFEHVSMELSHRILLWQVEKIFRNINKECIHVNYKMAQKSYAQHFNSEILISKVMKC